MGVREKKEEEDEEEEEEEEGGEAFLGCISSLFKEDDEIYWVSIEGLEEILEYKFGNIKLLRNALTHHSYSIECNEALAFLGDSVLNSVITKELYSIYTDFSPGQLTRLRAANVDNEKLAKVAVKHGLFQFLRHKVPQLIFQVKEFEEEILKYPLNSIGLVEVPKFLADIVEATIGAVFIDSNYSTDAVWKVFKKLLEPLTTPKTLQVHPKTELLELCQKNRLQVQIMNKTMEKSITGTVFVEGKLVATTSFSKKRDIVENRAAREALEHLKATLDATTNSL